MMSAGMWLGVLGCLMGNIQVTAPEDGDLPGLVDEPGEPGDVAPPGDETPSEPSEVEPPSDEPTGDEGIDDPGADDLTEPEPIEPEPTAPSDVTAGGGAPPSGPTSAAGAMPPPSPPPPRTTATVTSTGPTSRGTSPVSASSSAPASAEPAPKGDRDGKPAKAAPDEDEDDDDDEDADEKPEKFKHRGFIVDARVGLLGCTKRICKNHGAKPGFRLDGLLGRNILGFVDVALAGAWGTMRTNVQPGTDGLALYGLNRDALPPEAALLMLDQFTVDSARLETVQAGLDVRVHVIPRGRFDPYVGIGAQYSLFRALYDTPGGRTKLGFHGLAFPLQVGFVVFAAKRIAFGAQFDYLWSWYGGITIRGAPGRFAAPIPAIADAAAMAGVKLPGDLPNLWSVGAVVHLRLGR